MNPQDIREEAKIDLHSKAACDRLPPVTNSVDGEPTDYARAISWCERWIDEADVVEGMDPKRLAYTAASSWAERHP